MPGGAGSAPEQALLAGTCHPHRAGASLCLCFVETAWFADGAEVLLPEPASWLSDRGERQSIHHPAGQGAGSDLGESGESSPEALPAADAEGAHTLISLMS